MLVRAEDGQAIDISADAVRHVVPNQPAPTVYLRVSRIFLGLPTESEAPTMERVAQAGPIAEQAASAQRRTPVEGSDITIPVAEEQLTASVEWGERGRTHIHKRVAFENQRLVVPLTFEEVVVEHIAPEMFDANAQRPDDELIIPVVEERLVVRKEVVVKEYVRVRKQSSVRKYEVRGQVRHEVVNVDETPNPAFGDTAVPLTHERFIGATGATGATEQSPLP